MEYAQTHVLPRIYVSAKTIQTAKWLALFAMVIDHINKYLFNESNAWAFAIGRLAAPLFLIVLAYNLARPEEYTSGRALRVAGRCALFGIISTIPFVALGGLVATAYPANILFTLASAALAIHFLQSRAPILAVMVIAAAGAIVEFWWPALFIAVGAWAYFTKPSITALISVMAGFIGICLVNRNSFALAAIPLLFLCTTVSVPLPRIKWFFYAFYPAHLGLLWLARIPMRQAGYLFF